MSGVSLGHYWGKQHQDLKKGVDGNEKKQGLFRELEKANLFSLHPGKGAACHDHAVFQYGSVFPQCRLSV